MKCSRCNDKAITKMQHGHYCEKCFIHYIEKKVDNTITRNNLINKGENIGVAVSGGKDSLTVLYLVNKFMTRHRLGKPIAITIDVGTENYKDNLNNVKLFCEKENIPSEIITYKESYGKSLVDFMKIRDDKKIKVHSCAFCGVLKRQTLNKMAKKLKFNVLVTGHNMDDEAQTVVMNFFKGNKDIMPRQGMFTTPRTNDFIRRIKPLYFITNEETTLYTKLKGFSVRYDPCPYSEESYREDVKIMLNQFEDKYPGTKNSIVNTFLHILPKIKEEPRETNIEIKKCKKCGEPSTRDACKACESIENLLK